MTMILFLSPLLQTVILYLQLRCQLGDFLQERVDPTLVVFKMQWLSVVSYTGRFEFRQCGRMSRERVVP